jgi:hypothetical protein
MEVFIMFVAKKLQTHIGKMACYKIKPGTMRRTIQDENKLKKRSLNTIKLSIGEEIITEKLEEINSNLIKSERKTN